MSSAVAAAGHRPEASPRDVERRRGAAFPTRTREAGSLRRRAPRSHVHAWKVATSSVTLRIGRVVSPRYVDAAQHGGENTFAADHRHRTRDRGYRGRPRADDEHHAVDDVREQTRVRVAVERGSIEHDEFE